MNHLNTGIVWYSDPHCISKMSYLNDEQLISVNPLNHSDYNPFPKTDLSVSNTIFDDKTCQILTQFFSLFRVTFWLRERSPVPWERHWVPRAWTRWWFLPTMTSQLPTTERQFSSWWMSITRYLFCQGFFTVCTLIVP